MTLVRRARMVADARWRCKKALVATRGPGRRRVKKSWGRHRVEIEIKLVAPESVQLRRLRSVLGRICERVDDLGVARIADTYLDTSDWRVYRAGFACRIRREGGRLTLTLKALRKARRMMSVREEREQPLPAARGAAVWPLLRAPLHQMIGDAPLRSLFRVVNRRRRYRVRFERDLRALVGADSFMLKARNRTQRGAEVEIELISGSRAALRKLAKALTEELRLAPTGTTKFHEGLRLAGMRPGDSRCRGGCDGAV